MIWGGGIRKGNHKVTMRSKCLPLQEGEKNIFFFLLAYLSFCSLKNAPFSDLYFFIISSPFFSCRGRCLLRVWKTDMTVGKSLWPGSPLVFTVPTTAKSQFSVRGHREISHRCTVTELSERWVALLSFLSQHKKPLTVSPALKHSRVVNSLSCSLPAVIVCASADDYIPSRSVKCSVSFKCFYFFLSIFVFVWLRRCGSFLFFFKSRVPYVLCVCASHSRVSAGGSVWWKRCLEFLGCLHSCIVGSTVSS